MKNANFEKIVKSVKLKDYTIEDLVARRKSKKPKRNNDKRKY